MPPVTDGLRLLLLGAVFVVLCIAGISDVRIRRIPNWTVLSLLALFVPWAALGGPDSVPSSLMAALFAFLLSGIMYAFRLVGAGDSKLLTACALFVGWAHLLEFLVFMAIAGGLLAIAILSMQPALSLAFFRMREKAGLGRGIPYGVAITVAAIYVVGAHARVAPEMIPSWLP
jgi:prepilin peptidase CpaA